jgi:ATP-binding protein involved in chromosome partitioning
VVEALAAIRNPRLDNDLFSAGMIRDLSVTDTGGVSFTFLLAPEDPATLVRQARAAVQAIDGVRRDEIKITVTNPAGPARTTHPPPSTPTAAPPAAAPTPAEQANLGRIIAVSSGKGGVGKSTVTVNLAVAMARSGRKVGLIDADVYGHSVPAMLGVADERPTQVEDMIMPVPTMGLSVISIGMLKPRRDQVVAWRGPMLDRALVQMLSDVYWGDLDVLLLDLPPGTGDVAISVGQHLPSSEILVVTTPQAAAAEVAERAGTMAQMLHQRVSGVIENMSYLPCPHCGPEHRIEVFGAGGGAEVASTLTSRFGYDVPLLGQIPLDLGLRAGGDVGRPIVLEEPDSVAAGVIGDVAERLSARPRGLAGVQLGLSPAGR